MSAAKDWQKERFSIIKDGCKAGDLVALAGLKVHPEPPILNA